jgi:hypothetical protein
MQLHKLPGLGGWLTAECGFDAARRLVRVIEAQAAGNEGLQILDPHSLDDSRRWGDDGIPVSSKPLEINAAT